MKKILNYYLKVNDITANKVATDSGKSNTTLLRAINGDYENISTRIYLMLAKSLNRLPEKIFYEVNQLNDCLESLQDDQQYKTILDCDSKGTWVNPATHTELTNTEYNLMILKESFSDWLENIEQYHDEDWKFYEIYNKFLENEEDFEFSEQK
jgi:hypothetical protein